MCVCACVCVCAAGQPTLRLLGPSALPGTETLQQPNAAPVEEKPPRGAAAGQAGGTVTTEEDFSAFSHPK